MTACMQEAVGDRLALAVAIIQISWQAVLEGAQGPNGVDTAKFWQLAAEMAPKDIARVLHEAQAKELVPQTSPSGETLGRPALQA